MKNLNEKYINLLKEHHSNIKDDTDAKLVLDEIKDIIFEDKLETFIIEDLQVFANKRDAFDWFFDAERRDRISVADIIDFEIEQSMIGKSIMDILVESKENYINISDRIHLTYYY